MTRPQWVNLNGWWDYAICSQEATTPESFDGKIRVPYPVESKLSGVEKPLLPNQRLWYRRTFHNPLPGWMPGSPAKRILLHFGAVDEACIVWVNRKPAGEHYSGYLPFTFDITELMTEGENEIVVCVWDPTDTGLQQRGKQMLKPNGIWYTAISGIWQTVWLEVVPAVSISALRLTPDFDAQTLSVETNFRGFPQGVAVDVAILQNGTELVTARELAGFPVHLLIPDPHPWRLDDPFLYELRIQLVRDDQVIDSVGSYFAMRKFSLLRDAQGQPRFALNNEPVFLYGPLDQGYFPDGLYTPPSEEAMLFDIEYTRKLGCNMIRKHVKVEPLRWYYHCDRLGMIVWQDMPNGGLIDGTVVALLALTFGFQRNDTVRLG
jgi:beta-galactosidase/beta-glucuronidase